MEICYEWLFSDDNLSPEATRCDFCHKILLTLKSSPMPITTYAQSLVTQYDSYSISGRSSRLHLSKYIALL